MNTREKVALTIGTALLLCLMFLEPLRFIDNLFYDLNFVFSAKGASEQVVVVAFDSKSLAAIGGWPWNRSQIAEVIEKINICNPRVVALDLLLPKREGKEHNDELAMALKNVRQCIVPFRAIAFSPQKPASPLPMPTPLRRYRFLRLKNSDQLDRIHFYHATEFDVPDTLFLRYARYSGFLNMAASNTSQKLREVIHVLAAGEEYLPSFALSAVAAYFELKPEQFILDGKGKVWLNQLQVPLSTHAGSTWINFRSQEKPIHSISALDILNGAIQREQLQDKLVFIGVDDPAAGADFFITPVAAQYPGVKVWANAALDIFEHSWVQNGGGLIGVANWFLALVIFPGLAFFFAKKDKRLAFMLAIAFFSLSLMIGYFLFRQYSYFWNPAHHLFAGLFLLVWLATRKAPAVTTLLEPLKLEVADEAVVEPMAPPAADASFTPLKTETAEHVLQTMAGDVATVVMKAGGITTPPTPLASQKPEQWSAEQIARFQTIGGSKIVKLLGSGGMADVYLVWNPRMEVYRAVKVLKPNQPESHLKRFETEIRIFAKLDHPNIVHCYGVGEWHGLPYVEMEFIDGASLEEIVRRCGALSCEQAAIIGILICRALDYAHKLKLSLYGQTYNGIIHRDLKPANVMISRIGRIKLTDFGIARPATVSLHTVDSGNVVGTLPYLSPEQIDGQAIDNQSDIYALGLVMYEMLTGSRAFPQKQVSALISAKSQGKMARPLIPSPTLPRPVVDIVDTATKVDKKERYSDASQMMADLERFLRDRLNKPGYLYIQQLVDQYWSKAHELEK